VINRKAEGGVCGSASREEQDKIYDYEEMIAAWICWNEIGSRVFCFIRMKKMKYRRYQPRITFSLE
jgi:hypothetical protein